jgi:hypothetical protein
LETEPAEHPPLLQKEVLQAKALQAKAVQERPTEDQRAAVLHLTHQTRAVHQEATAGPAQTTPEVLQATAAAEVHQEVQAVIAEAVRQAQAEDTAEVQEDQAAAAEVQAEDTEDKQTQF